jgi:hypothetical protein
VSFYVALGGGRFRATEHTIGPWDRRHQHAGPPAALLTGALERCEPRPEMALARITLEILGAVPVAEVEVEVGVERPGRSVELLAGELRAGGRPMVRVRAWRVLAAPDGTGTGGGPAPLPLPPSSEAADAVPRSFGEFGYAHSIEFRWARGGWLERGPATVWTRMRVPLVEGEEPSSLQRVMVVADSGNGVSAVLDWASALFINPELSVHLLRPPAGEWVCLEAETEIAAGGAGLARSVLSDPTGPVARGAQSLLIGSR